jgi:hypothetical protein
VTYFSRMSRNVTFTSQNPGICSTKVTNQYDGNKRSQEAISAHIRDIKPLNRSDMTHYKELVPLRKGQRVTLKSGKVLVVDGFSDSFFWAIRESLPYFRGDVV